MDRQLQYIVTKERLQNEYEFYLNSPGRCNNVTTKNEIVKYFQQDSFFAYEKQMFNNPEIAKKIIDNRRKYLNKENISSNEILVGFKKSGMHYGYSHFNPLLFKWFINEYHVSMCCDPFGGWGHRLLGGMGLDKYIYNDLSYSTCCGVDAIAKYFNIKNIDIYNLDVEDFIGNSLLDYDSIFTCPPYYNTEHYECGDFDSYDEYVWKLDSVLFAFENNSRCKVMGVVLREDLLPESYMRACTKTIPVGIKQMHHLRGSKRNAENLYIFEK